MTATSKHDLRSITKSVVSALTGITLSEGAIKSLDQPVVQWFPEFPDLNTSERRRVTLAHVLSMTSGLRWNEEVPYSNPENDEIRMTRDARPLRYALSVPFAVDPVVGSEIQQIRLGRYDVQFSFGSGRTICVQGDVEIFEQNTLVATWNEEENWSSTAFQTLLNAKVLSYSVVNDRLLEIKFEGDLVLHLHDSSDQYESMQIYPEGIII